MPTHTIDQEWRDLWIRAEVHIPLEAHEDHGTYFGTPYSRTIYESGEVEILDVKLFSYDEESQGYETPVEDERLEQARKWLKEKDYE